MNMDVVIYSSVRLSRNLKGWKFVSRLTSEDIGSITLAETEAMDRLPGFRMRCLDDFSFAARQLMAEKNHILPQTVIGSGKYIVYGESSGDCFTVFNEEDHIRIKCFVPGADLIKAYGRCAETDAALRSVFEYQEHPVYGYLTSSVSDSGTGLHACSTFFLPGMAMEKRLDKFFAAAAQAGMLVKGYVDTSDSTPKGNIFIVENRVAAGKDPMEILPGMTELFKQVAEMERESRKRLLEGSRLDLEDKVMRAYGILRYCRKLTVWEALELISDIKLGAGTGLIDIPDMVINSLFIKIQKYHLLSESRRERNERPDIDCLRADFIREKLGIGENK